MPKPDRCSRRRGDRRYGARPAAGMGARRPSIHSTTPRYPVAWWPDPCRVGLAPAARGREAEPAGLQSPAKTRTCGCPERRGPRCSERSRRCCSGHRPHLGAEAVQAGPGRSTARSRTSPSRPGPPTRKSTGASKPSRAVWGFAAYSPCPPTAVLQPQVLVPQPSAMSGPEGVPHPREPGYAGPGRVHTTNRFREVRVGACEGSGCDPESRGGG
jgi:hypothetical protein